MSRILDLMAASTLIEHRKICKELLSADEWTRRSAASSTALDKIAGLMPAADLLDVVRLVATQAVKRGKDDWEISLLLGLAADWIDQKGQRAAPAVPAPTLAPRCEEGGCYMFAPDTPERASCEQDCRLNKPARKLTRSGLMQAVVTGLQMAPDFEEENGTD